MMDRCAGRKVRCLIFALAGFFNAALAQPGSDPTAIAAARAAFIDRMVAEHGVSREVITPWLESTVIDSGILESIARPAERVVPWFDYRQIFLNADRISRGAEFWRSHRVAIDRTADRFNVDPKIIVSIIGVETFYGTRMGRHRVIDALATLAFAYPPRSAFFTRELENFVLLNREQDFAWQEVRGSYAGAMGAGQFIPSSYRAYAVDGDNDGRRDLWENWDDIFASVANYLGRHGWRRGEPVAVIARQTRAAIEPDNALALDATITELRSAGYEFETSLNGSAEAAVFSFERNANENEYWIGFNNFYVITRYNRSPKYALAVLQLADAIEAEMVSGAAQ